MVNVEPYLKLWYAHYHDDRGLTVVGVHSPKFPHERDVGKVRVYARKFGIIHPVANDNDYIIWKGYANGRTIEIQVPCSSIKCPQPLSTPPPCPSLPR